MAKYFRQVYRIEVLTEGEPLGDVSMEDIAEAITHGHASGMFLDTEVEEVTEERMAELLTAQGSDPDFLIMPDEEEGY